jgi:hypothetical protein
LKGECCLLRPGGELKMEGEDKAGLVAF